MKRFHLFRSVELFFKLGVFLTCLHFVPPFKFKKGRVRTKTVKRAARLIVEKYFVKLTLDFYINKRIIQEIATIQSNRLTNRITGYTTHLMKRIRSGPARGISFKLQEEERERRDQYVPSKSVFITKKIELDQATAVSPLCHFYLLNFFRKLNVKLKRSIYSHLASNLLSFRT